MKTDVLCLMVLVAALLAPNALLKAQTLPLPTAGGLYPTVTSLQASAAAERIKLCNDDDMTCYCTPPRFEATAALLYLQPGSGSLEYGTLVNPLPAPSPHWENQAIRPNFAPAFNFGLRYFVPNTANDVATSWTHLDTTSSASFAGGPTQFAGPPFLIGPGANAFNLGAGSVHFRYDAVNLEAGHTWRANDPFQLRFFGGVQIANISQNLTGTFSDFAGDNTQSNTTTSKFTGAGPRIGINARFNRPYFQFFGDFAAVALIGSQQLRMDFNTTSSTFPGGNPQSFTSPNATQVVPGLDTRLGGAYSFQLGRGTCKLEAGYMAVAYINAINSYSLTQVATPPVVSSIGVFFATAEHLQNTFTAHGPFLSADWLY